MNLFKELWEQGKLAARRNPMFYKNKTAKVWIYIGVAFWACYLILFGVLFAFGFDEGGRESYQVLNSGLIFILAIDFLTRFPFQQLPTQEVKPYLLLPVKRRRIIDFLLIRSGLDLYNLFWFFFFVPFSCISMFRFFGVFGIFSYLIGIWLLFVLNNYWFLLCRTLMNEHIAWLLLPIAVYGAVAAAIFVPAKSIVGDLFIDLGDGFIQCNLLFFLVTILIIAYFWLVNRKIMGGLIYKEINKVDDVKIKHLSEYKFLDRYGMLGEFLRLEIKMLLRNRTPKASMRMLLVLIIIFAALLSFTKVYDQDFMKLFITMYAFSAVAISLLMMIMSYEGNYIDGLMVRKECILTLLKAKYYLSSLYAIIPFLIMIPSIIAGKVSFLFVLSMCFFTIGVIYFMLFQLAVYNTDTILLNAKITRRQSTSSMQKLFSFLIFIIPMVAFYALDALFGKTVGDIILFVIGLGFVLTSNIWLRNIYKRFMKRRYKNMDELRASRVHI